MITSNGIERRIILLVMVLLYIGCDDSDIGEPPEALMRPIGLSDELVFIDREESRAYLLDVMASTPQPRVEVRELPANPFYVEKRQGSDELLILCSGQREQEGQEGESSALAVLDSEGEVRRYEIESSFNTLQQSSDGRYGFVYLDKHLNTEQSSDKRVEMGQNAVLIDLQEELSEGDRPRTILLGNSQGDVPQGVSFSEEMEISGVSLRLAAIYSRHLIWLLDLSSEKTPPITVEPEVGKVFDFEQVIFDQRKGRVYMRGRSSESIHVLEFTEAPSGKQNRFWPTVRDPRLVGMSPTDMVLYSIKGEGTAEQGRLLILSDNGYRATVMSTDNSDRVEIELSTPASRILLYTLSEDTTETPYALLYDDRETLSRAITFVDLGTVKISGEGWLQTESVETVYLDEPFNMVTPLGVNDYVLMKSEEGGMDARISLLDLRTRNIYPIETHEALRVLPDAEMKKLWLPPASFSEGHVLSYLDLESDSLVSKEVWLDASIEELLTFGTASERRVVVVHPSEVGYVTILDGQSLSRSDATSLQGFFVSGLLD